MTGFDPAALHLLRPEWLWALLALPLLAAAWWWRRRRDDAWAGVVDAHLRAHLVDRRTPRIAWLGAALAATGYAIAVLALSGPSWRQQEQPLWRSQQPLVVAMELSDAMLAADPPPSRLAQAKARLERLLDERRDVPVGLVVYAAQAFTVAPVTDDGANVALFLEALAPDIMPRDGAAMAQGIRHAVELMRQAGFERGTVLVMAGQADPAAVEAATEAAASGFRVDVLGLGQRGGVPYRTPDGDRGFAAFDEALLGRVASAGGGRYARIAGDGADLRALATPVLDTAAGRMAVDGADAGGLQWQDEGFWLVPPLLLLALFAFRRGGAVAVLALALCLPWTPAGAADLWRRADQRVHQQMESASRAYREGDFKAAADAYARVDDADAHYNRGNALAKAGRYPQAIEAYDRALALEPGMEDAIANRNTVRAAMERPPDEGGEGDQGDTGGDAAAEPQEGSGSDPGDPGEEGEPGDGRAPGSPSPPSQDGEGDDGDAPDGGGSDAADGEARPPAAADPDAQSEADRAQRERMAQALESERAPDDPAPGAIEGPPGETPEARERRVANEAWLRRVPDDPGGLLRDKFRIEYERRRRAGELED